MRDTFSVQVVLPEDAAGTTLAFPVLQTCEVGSTNWDQVQKEGEAEPEHPAPSVTVTAEVAMDDDGDVVADDDHHAGDERWPRIPPMTGSTPSPSDSVLAGSSSAPAPW